MGEEEADPTLELAMEYASTLGTIIFDESCHLYDLTEAQIGQNQFTVDVTVDQLDGEVDHASERICHRGRPLVGFPCLSLQPKRPCISLFSMVPARLEPSTGLLGLVGYLGVVSWSMG